MSSCCVDWGPDWDLKQNKHHTFSYFLLYCLSTCKSQACSGEGVGRVLRVLVPVARVLVPVVRVLVSLICLQECQDLGEGYARVLVQLEQAEEGRANLAEINVQLDQSNEGLRHEKNTLLQELNTINEVKKYQ